MPTFIGGEQSSAHNGSGFTTHLHWRRTLVRLLMEAGKRAPITDFGIGSPNEQMKTKNIVIFAISAVAILTAALLVFHKVPVFWLSLREESENLDRDILPENGETGELPDGADARSQGFEAEHGEDGEPLFSEINLNDNNQTLSMIIGESFALNLDENYDWKVSVDSPDVIGKDESAIPPEGSLGIFSARKAGEAVLSAAGDPECRESEPPCGMPSVSFKLNVEVIERPSIEDLESGL